jgi:hypothetical protein
MLDKHTTKIYPTEYAAKRAAERLNEQRTPAEIEHGRYFATPNHLGWIVAPAYY